MHSSALSRIRGLVTNQSNALWILSERAANSAFNLIVIVAITRIMGPVNYGHWAFAFSIVSILLATGHLGLDGLLVKKIVEKPERAPVLLGVVSSLKFTIYLPVIGFTLGFFSFETGLSGEEHSLLMALMVSVLFAPLTSSLLAWTNANSAFAAVSRMRFLASFIGTLAKLAVISGGYGIITVGIAHSAMWALEALLLLIIVKRLDGPMPWHWRFENGVISPLLSQSIFLFAAAILAMLYSSIDIIVLRIFRGAYEVGLYALVPQIILALQLIPYALTLAAFPALAAAADAPDNRAAFLAQISRLQRQLLVLSGLIVTAVAGFALFGFELVFGSAYAETVPVLLVACLALPTLFLRQLTTNIYICTNQGRLLAVIEFAGLLLAVAINLVLVPRYGGMGAIAGFIAASFTTVVISLLLFHRKRFARPIKD